MHAHLSKSAAVTLVLALSAAGSSLAAPFTIVLLPDTQHYSDSAVDISNFDAQTQWIVDNRAAENIVFISQVGDVVENGGEGPNANQIEWDRAVAALDTLHDDPSDPPYSTVLGNHDSDIIDDKTSASQYITHLGPGRYAGKVWFAGAAPDQVNMAQDFFADGNLFLHIGLEYLPSDDAIAWAQSVITDNPKIPVILSTHIHLGKGSTAPRLKDGETPDSTGSNDASSVYHKLIEPFPQVFLLLSGHVWGNGRLASTTALGHPVHEVMTDYQNDPNGGNAFMQLLEFDPASSEIEFETFSPTYVPGVTAGPDRSIGSAGNYVLDYDINAQHDRLRSRTTLHFRQGQDHGFGVYAGAVDTHVGDGGAPFPVVFPDAAHGSEETVRVDLNSDHEQGLLRFENILGPGVGKIRPGVQIEKAILTLTTEGLGNDGDGATLHRMLLDWDDDTTWNELGGGVQLGSEAEAIADVDTGSTPKGTRSYDVTTSVQAWIDGAPNHGWVFLSNSNNRWEFRSSEWMGLVERPMLTVEFSNGPCADGIDNDGDGRTDRQDADCSDAFDLSEAPDCSDGLDNDGDGKIDEGPPGTLADVGCSHLGDRSERDPSLTCDDGIDGDGDGLIDFPADPGCRDPQWYTEAPACSDGTDNDFDGLTDEADPACTGRPWRDRETGGGSFCGLGFESVLVAPLLARLDRRRRRRSG